MKNRRKRLAKRLMIPMYLVIVKSKDVRPPSLFLKSETKRMYCSATKTDARTVRQLSRVLNLYFGLRVKKLIATCNTPPKPTHRRGAASWAVIRKPFLAESRLLKAFRAMTVLIMELLITEMMIEGVFWKAFSVIMIARDAMLAASTIISTVFVWSFLASEISDVMSLIIALA